MRSDLVAAALGLALAGLALHAAPPARAQPAAAGEALRFEWIVGPAKRPVEMRPAPGGGYEYRLPRGPGPGGGWLDAAAFQERVAAEARRHAGRHALLRLVNASSWPSFTWVVVGLAGQLCFFGRMFLQWLASEREGASVVPPVFWWLSLVGGAALLAYFLWRRDPIGILGQSTGTLVYARNLWLLRGGAPGPALREAP